MKLPNVELAVVPERKITGYLLSETHPRGRHKARFFRAIGFAVGEWEALAQALRDHAVKHDIAGKEHSPLGERFIVDGIIESPTGASTMIRSVWFIDSGESIPRFITAFPFRRGHS